MTGLSSPTIFRFLCFLTFVTTSAAVDRDATCYFLNGQIADQDVPCNISAETSICCNKNDICLSNGLCYLQHNSAPAFSRGSCTSQDWSGECANHKPCARWDRGNGYKVVNALSDQYCCGSVVNITDSTIECEKDRIFHVDKGTVVPGVAALADFTTSTSVPSGGSNSNDSCAAASGTSENNDQSTRLAIGLGLGIPLGIIAGSALIWGGWERKQRAASTKELEQLKANTAATMGMGMGPGPYGYGMLSPSPQPSKRSSGSQQ
ncbi:hypothetical protein BDV59DRAFT_195180 [Aspergillus ambiguus]|uniref:uncharacterized protein n=1 Tax=Aspergillus ambiguus TaxID=176160 RepID=UPI003CCCC56B